MLAEAIEHLAIRPEGMYLDATAGMGGHALAIARRVPVLMLDEPTTGLDPRATADFNRLLQTARARGVATLMVTHDLLGASEVADRIGFLAEGRIVVELAAEGPERFDLRALHQRYAQAGTAA